MKISEVMTPDPEIVSPDQPIQEAARKMLDADTGVLPVGEGERLIGMVTDRDIAVRGIAEGRGPDTPVREVMSEKPLFVWDDHRTVSRRSGRRRALTTGASSCSSSLPRHPPEKWSGLEMSCGTCDRSF